MPLIHSLTTLLLLIFTLITFSSAGLAQVNKEVLADGSVTYQDIVFKTTPNRTLSLDIYLPNDEDKTFPLLVWLHGGAWMRGSPKDFPGKNANLAESVLAAGYAVATVGYRLSHEAPFPAQIQDVNDAIQYLYKHHHLFNLNKERIGIMGRSAGAHLASLAAASNNQKVNGFVAKGSKKQFDIKVVVDMFGPSDLIALRGNSGQIDHDDPEAAEAKLLGQPPLKRPDLAKWASPTTYINKNSPPFIILHGDADTIVPHSQSILLSSYLDLAGVPNELIIAEQARHGDPIFDGDENVQLMVNFLEKHFPAEN